MLYFGEVGSTLETSTVTKLSENACPLQACGAFPFLCAHSNYIQIQDHPQCSILSTALTFKDRNITQVVHRHKIHDDSQLNLRMATLCAVVYYK